MRYPTEDSPGGTRSRRVGAWLLFGAVAQIASTAVVGLFADLSFGGGTSEPTITPAGYAFSIWGLVLLLSLLYAVQVARQGLAAEDPHRVVIGPLLVTFAGFCLWLGAASFDALWATWATVAIFAVMAVALDRALGIAYSANGTETSQLLRFAVGVYAGWSTVAVFVNLASALSQSGLRVNGAGAMWQAALLVIAVVALVRRTVKTRSWPYGAAAGWALIAAAIGAAQQSACGLSVLAVVSAVLLLLVGVRHSGTARR